MKIKLPFTEKFLWDLYNFMDKTENLAGKIITRHAGNPAIAFKEIFFPNFYVFRDKWMDKHKNKKDRKRFYELVCKLKNRGYLKRLKVKNKDAAILTSKGTEKLFRINLKTMDKKPRADGKWQMVLFDIPENKRKNRDYFRDGLRYLGYKNLQKSIWVCQYDVMKETKELIKRYNLEPFVEVLLVKKIGVG